MENCRGCNVSYDDSFADWTICRDCAVKQHEQAGRVIVYMDQLGIAWTQEELDEAGGLEEVKSMAKEGDARGKFNI